MALTKPNVAKKTETAAAVVEEKMTSEGVETTAKANPPAEVVEDTRTEEAAEQVETTTTAAVQAEPEQEVEQPTATTEVATTDAPTGVTEARSTSMAKFTKEQADAGFEGLEITGMSFDRIKLHEGKFLIGSEEAELGTEFDCIVHSTRNIFVVRQSTDNDAEAFYSYDEAGKTFTDGTSAREKLEEWAEDGYGTEENPLDIRPYLEAMITLQNRDDEFADQMAVLSIPPASKARLSGAAAQAYTKFRGARLDAVITRCIVGKKVGEGQKAFRPWLFRVVERIEG